MDAAAKDQMVARAYSLGYEYEQKFHNCPQCVLATIQEVLGLVDDAVFKAAHSLAGGGGITGMGTCGALVGGMLAVGSRHGRAREDFGRGRYMESYRRAKSLYDRFVQEYGSPICGDVQRKLFGRRYDLWEEYDAFEAAGAHVDRCPTVVGRTAAWTVEVLLDEGE